MYPDKEIYIFILAGGAAVLAWFGINDFFFDAEYKFEATSTRKGGRLLLDFLFGRMGRQRHYTDPMLFILGGNAGPTPTDNKNLHAAAAPFLLGIALFGLVGWCLTVQQWEPASVLIAAALTGVGMTLVLVLLPIMIMALAETPLHIREALGQAGVVEKTIPGLKDDFGTIRLTLRGQPVLLKATTPQEEVRSGTAVVVIGIIGLDAVEVVPEAAAEADTTKPPDDGNDTMGFTAPAPSQ